MNVAGRKKIAIVGTGISGLTCGYYLHKEHDVTLFEANDYIGGHTATVDVRVDGKEYAIDTGFIVYNDRTYPNFIKMMNEIGVEGLPTQMVWSTTVTPCRHCLLKNETGQTQNSTALSQRSFVLTNWRKALLTRNRQILRRWVSFLTNTTSVHFLLITTYYQWVLQSGHRPWQTCAHSR